MPTTDLRTARKRRRLKQEELAERSGVGQSTISRLEKGRIARPSDETIEALESALRLKPGTLVFAGSQEASAP
jgi:transcriptional regulator with XRE-family HTH domain